jgi:hypothetical protein
MAPDMMAEAVISTVGTFKDDNRICTIVLIQKVHELHRQRQALSIAEL